MPPRLVTAASVAPPPDMVSFRFRAFPGLLGSPCQDDKSDSWTTHHCIVLQHCRVSLAHRAACRSNIFVLLADVHQDHVAVLFVLISVFSPLTRPTCVLLNRRAFHIAALANRSTPPVLVVCTSGFYCFGWYSRCLSLSDDMRVMVQVCRSISLFLWALWTLPTILRCGWWGALVLQRYKI